jgi:hypothetical protein
LFYGLCAAAAAHRRTRVGSARGSARRLTTSSSPLTCRQSLARGQKSPCLCLGIFWLGLAPRSRGGHRWRSSLSPIRSRHRAALSRPPCSESGWKTPRVECENCSRFRQRRLKQLYLLPQYNREACWIYTDQKSTSGERLCLEFMKNLELKKIGDIFCNLLYL